MEPVELVTSTAMGAGRLHLRPWDAGDVETVLRAGSDPAVQRWTLVPAPYTRADAEDFVARYVPQSWADGGELVWAVCDAVSGTPLASVGLHPGPEGVRAVGYWCLPEARGRGVVPAAVQVVARWAFAELGLARLEWAAETGAEPRPGGVARQPRQRRLTGVGRPTGIRPGGDRGVSLPEPRRHTSRRCRPGAYLHPYDRPAAIHMINARFPAI